MRAVKSQASALVALALVGACQAPATDSSAFTTIPGPGATPGGTAELSSSSSTGSGGTTVAVVGSSSSSGGGGGTTTGWVHDLGDAPDFSVDNPVGCKGKIDFLFVIARNVSMRWRQEQLIDAFPTFITTIESKFADFDYHIMVVDGDAGWGLDYCTADCPELDCKIGDACCSANPEPEWVGKPCCGDPDYPCDLLGLVNDCDHAFGAGTVFPAGHDSSNKPCPIDGGYRYMAKGQADLSETFACVAKLGIAGGARMGQALTAAMQSNINDPGGCNNGFLRKDALLMVTLISSSMDYGGGGLHSKGTPEEWAQAVLDAKQGDPNAVVFLNILIKDCPPQDGLCKMVQMFPNRVIEDVDVKDFGPAFDKATGLVEAACAGFVPPG